MLAIGRALMAGPRVLLLDEPSLGLAPRIVEQLGEVIREINRRGVTVVLVEQNAAMALAVADRAVVLEVGRVALAGSAAELAESERVRDRYLGAAPAADARATRPRRRSSPATSATTRPLRHSSRVAELVVDGLTVRFGGITALDEVSFTVAPGSMHALIGPNGAGKSTCLNVLSGVYAASAGSVRYGDAELTRLRPHRVAALGVARTFQNISLSPTATVLDNLLVARHRLMREGFVTGGLRLPRARRERARHVARVREVAALHAARGRARAARGHAVLRHAQAARAGAGAVRGAGAAAARRAGGRDDAGGVGGDGPRHRGGAGGARDLGARGRARHGAS